jgi:hypothetical protein
VKANDSIPYDEMLLAEAIAAAKSRGLGWASHRAFVDASGAPVTRSKATACCALGGLALAGRLSDRIASASQGQVVPTLDISTTHVFRGNDTPDRWMPHLLDVGESLGWAFRCAMTQEAE